MPIFFPPARPGGVLKKSIWLWVGMLGSVTLKPTESMHL